MTSGSRRRGTRAGFTLVEAVIAGLLLATLALVVFDHLSAGRRRHAQADRVTGWARDANLCLRALRRDLGRIVLRTDSTSHPVAVDEAGVPGIAFDCWNEEGEPRRVRYSLVAVGDRRAVTRAEGPSGSATAPGGSAAILTHANVLDFQVSASGLDDASATVGFLVHMVVGSDPALSKGAPPPTTFDTLVFPEAANRGRPLRHWEVQ